MSNKNRLKLSRELGLGVLLLATPIFILALGALYRQSRFLIHEEVTKTSNSTVNTALLRLKNYMNTVETGVDANMWMLERNFRPDSLRAISNRIVRLNTNVVSSSVYVVPGMLSNYGIEGEYSIYTTRLGKQAVTYTEPEYHYTERACYMRPINSGKPCWLDPFSENVEVKVDYKQAIATYCAPITHSDGQILGVVTADISFNGMTEVLNAEEPPYKNARYILLGGDGRFLMFPDTTRLFNKTVFAETDPNRDMDLITAAYEMTAGNQGAVHTNYHNKRYHVSYLPVPGTDWSLAMACPDKDAMGTYFRLGYIIIALLVIGLLAIALLCHHVVKKAVRPLSELITTTGQMADGCYDCEISTSDHKEIIPQLQNSFALMQKALHQRMSGLQQKVSEMRRKNEELEGMKQEAEEVVKRKNTFIHHVTQQMRMPQNVITGFADVINESNAGTTTVSNEELNSITGMMKTNAVNMDRMVLLLGDATDTDANEVLHCKRQEEVPCNVLCRECIDHARTHYPEVNIQLETKLREGVCILTNHNYLMRILRELLYNAAKFSDGQQIMLTVDETENTVRFTVEDKGPGLPSDLSDLSLKAFSTSAKGLALVKRHTEGLKGSMVIDTNYHEGCRITIEMPK